MRGLVFIRHAETDMAGTFCGHSDPDINAAGKAQLAGLISRLAGESFDAIYSSDLTRAVSTAEALAEAFAVRITTASRLREIHFGEWEGMTWTEVEQRDPATARRWLESFPALQAPEGESFAAFESRVMEEVAGLLLLAEDQRIAVVTHAGVMCVILRALLGYSLERAWELTSSYCCSFAYSMETTSPGVRQ